MFIQNDLRFIKKTIYSLKRQYGCFMNLYRKIEVNLNLQTGEKSIVKNIIPIKRAILLPAILSRKFVRDLKGHDFGYGGFYDIETRTVIVDTTDLPKDFDFNIDIDSIVFNKKLYELKSAELFEHGYAFLLTLKETVGALPYELIDVKAESNLNLNQVVNE